jgi:hypothetical protein
VNVKVPEGIPDIIVPGPVPVVELFPGDRITVHDSADGNPLSTTLPVGTKHVGPVIAPTIGAEGDIGCTEIVTFPDGAEEQPTEFVTEKVYVPAGRFAIVADEPEPVVTTFPGERFNVHVPVNGNPVNVTLPVDTEQVGCTIVFITGAVGIDGGEVITTVAADAEVHPTEFVTVKVNVPTAKPVIVVLVPVPVVVTPLGFLVSVQVPDAGSPVRFTLPVGTAQVGCVIVPTCGSPGIAFTVSS